MGFNNVPVNGWPQIKDLEKLDALAKQIEDMPAFTSDDRAWLNEWEEKLPELPEDPETDGVKVLTATTSSGETVKSWETPESGNADYSTNEVDTGIKWIDGKNLYRKVFHFVEETEQTSKDYSITELNADYVMLRDPVYKLGAVASSIVVSGDQYLNNIYNRVATATNSVISVTSEGWSFVEFTCVLYYTKNLT